MLRIIIPAYPAFNIYSSIATRTTALGPASVAASAREAEGWEVEVVDENNLRRFAPLERSGRLDHGFLQRQRPADVAGFYGGLTSTIPRVYELARFYRSGGAITIAGGQHFVEETIPEAFGSGIDYILRDEAEETVKEFLRALAAGKSPEAIDGIVYRDGEKIVLTRPRPPLLDLDVLPLPDFSLFRFAKIKLYPVGRVRGCGMDCEFCTVKGLLRCASAERLVLQVSKVVETMGASEFFIVDDLFGQNRGETLRLCRLLGEYQKSIGRRLQFTVQIRLDKARDTELLEAMRSAGIVNVAIGFESPIRQELLAMNKKLRPEDMLEMSANFHGQGFFTHGMFIFGYPMKEGVEFTMDVRERIKHFKRFIRQSRVDTIQVLLPVPIPGTELRTRLLRHHRIYPLTTLGWEYYDGNFPLFAPDAPLTPEGMQFAIRKIMGRFYNLRYLFMFLLNIFSFPHLVFYLDDLKSGWRVWYRRWRNYIFRFGGWIIVKNWTRQLEQGPFIKKLEQAKKQIKTD